MTYDELDFLIDRFWNEVVPGIEKSPTLTGEEAQVIAEALEDYKDKNFD